MIVPPWLDSLPEDWRTIPLRFVLRRKKETGFADEEMLSVYRDYGVIPKASRDDNFNRAGKDLDAYQLVRPGELAINKMKAWQGSLGVSAHRGIVSPAYFVFRVRREIDGRYLHHLLRCDAYIQDYKRISGGVRPNQWDLDLEAFGKLPCLVPPLATQRAIADFLDRKTAAIDDLIAKKEKLIELLEEKRAALINQAVTKGLDPNVPMKDSGIAWIGEIPTHWSTPTLRRYCSITRLAGAEYTAFWAADPNGEIVALRGQNIRDNRLVDLDSAERITRSLSSKLHRSALSAGDVVFPCVGSIGNAAEIKDDGRFHINQNIAKLTPKPELNSTFLAFYLMSKTAKAFIHVFNTSGIQPSVLVGSLRAFVIPLPPRHEQDRIAEWLQQKLDELSQIELRVARQIALISEYRQSLITAAVTGQLDVGAAEGEAA